MPPRRSYRSPPRVWAAAAAALGQPARPAIAANCRPCRTAEGRGRGVDGDAGGDRGIPRTTSRRGRVVAQRRRRRRRRRRDERRRSGVAGGGRGGRGDVERGWPGARRSGRSRRTGLRRRDRRRC